MSNKNFHDLSKRRKRDYLNSIRTVNDALYLNNNENQFANVPLNPRNHEIIGRNDNNLNANLNNVERDLPFHNAADTVQINDERHQNDIENEFQNQNINQSVYYVNEEYGLEANNLNDEPEQREDIDQNRDMQIAEEVANLDRNDVEEEEDDEEEQIFDESDDEDEEENENSRINNALNYDLPLYKEAPLTISQSMVLIATLLITHNVTQSCLVDFISILNLHCLKDSLYKNSLFKFKKFFALGNQNSTNHTKHYYCLNCFKGLTSSKEACSVCVNSKSAHFITLSISEQLQELYNRPGFYQQLQHRFRQPNLNAQNINDVYDGTVYQNLVSEGFLADKNNISFMWYTDGVPVFKSSRVSIWPLYLTINELPFKERSKRHNLLLAGLWFGDTKPDANLFIDKLHSQFVKLHNGQNCALSDGQEIFVRAALLFGTCDSPAKTQFLNFKQFNGFYGCPVCLEPGETYHCSTGGTTHIYKYIENPTMRTSQQSREHGDIALKNNSDHFGVKGPCALSSLMPDFIAGTAIDKMHCIDNGVVKKLLSLWFDNSYSSCAFSLFPVIQVINERLASIKPPKFVHRLPRALEELSHWKASELRMWFFYYSLPVLSGIMQNIYLEHFMLLVTSIAYLSSDSISHEMIDKAEILLKKFVLDFETLYGLQNCSINLHSLLHLPEYVRRIGPLWTTSCYVFEDLNGQFLRLIHGTRYIDSQIANTHGQSLRMQKYLQQLPDGPVRDFCTNRTHGIKICEKVRPHCYSVGTYKYYDNFPEFLYRAVSHLLPIRNIKKYYRLLKNGQLYVSEQYSRDLKTLSSDIQYTDNAGASRFGRIFCFIKITECECMNACYCRGTHHAIIKNFEFNHAFEQAYRNDTITVPYLYRFTITEQYVAVPVKFLKSVCISMRIEDQVFISVPVNTKELE